MDHLITLLFFPWLLVWNLTKNRTGKDFPINTRGSVLVIATGGIGDTLLSLPAVKSLRKNFPGLKISVWVSDPGTGAFFQEKGLVDSLLFYPFHRFFNPLGFFSENIKFLFKLRRFKFHHVLIAEPSQNIISAVAAFFSGANVRIGPRYRLGKIDDTDFLLTHSLPFSYERHVLEVNLDLLKFLGLKDITPDLNLCVQEKEKGVVDSLLKETGLAGRYPMVGMHIGANPNQLYKCWDPEKFAQISDFLSLEYDARVVIAGGVGEKSQVEKLIANTKRKPVNLVGKLGIIETAAFLAKCDLFITNDSGPMHIAAAVKTPIIAIFGPSRPKKNAPFGRHIIIRKELDCSPCYDWKFSRIAECSHLKCMGSISVDDVKPAIRSMLEQK